MSAAAVAQRRALRTNRGRGLPPLPLREPGCRSRLTCRASKDDKGTIEQVRKFGEALKWQGMNARQQLENHFSKRDRSSDSWHDPASFESEDIERYVRETLITPVSHPRSFFDHMDKLKATVATQWQRVLYVYYNWRKDTGSDLLIIFALNSFLIMSGALLKYALVDPFLSGTASDPVVLAEQSSGQQLQDLPIWARIWPDIYDVTLLTFGENFPDSSESWVLQLYSVAMGLLGVVSFALVLALTERIILEVIESNVQQGTQVFEKGHVIVLAHCVAGKDMECIWRILNQTIWAYASEGGTTIVVLCNREKTTMEKVYRRAIPDTKGSTIVFRQGNPLLPGDLSQVSCPSAESIIVVSDNSREANEADAQTVRTCILIDELIQKSELEAFRAGRMAQPAPHVVVELLNSENCQALQFVTDIDVHMVLTRNMNAKRLARMVLAPVIAGVSSMLFDFRTDSQQYTQCFPELKGKLFKDVPFLFDAATVVGLFPSGASEGELVVTPSPGYVMQEDDVLLILRSSLFTEDQIQPDVSRRRPTLSGWRPPMLQDMMGQRTNQEDDALIMTSGNFQADSRRSGGSNGSNDSNSNDSAILIPESLSRRSGSNDDADNNGNGARHNGNKGRAAAATEQEAKRDGAAVFNNSSHNASVADATRISSNGAAEAHSASRYYVLPNEYIQSRNENDPVKVLIVGWGEQSFMQALLYELDKGEQSLPVASHVVFLNSSTYESTVGKAVERVGVTCLHVSHVKGNPLAARTFTHLVDISEFSCAMCLCDMIWMDPDADSSNGIDFMEQSDMLRLDSMLLLSQLNIRNALKKKNLQDINIICEKLAITGVTRFEDRFRLPLGISVNMTSYAAKLLVQTMYDPEHGIQLITSFGRNVNINVLDSSALCTEGEELSWWDLVARAQTCRLVLFAYYDIPQSLDIPLKLHSNPTRDRTYKRVWNEGSNRRKLICFEARAPFTGVDALEEATSSDDSTVDIRWKLRQDGNVMMTRPPPALENVDEDVEVLDLNDGMSVRNYLMKQGVAMASWDAQLRGRPQGLRTFNEADHLASRGTRDSRDGPAPAPRTAAQAAMQKLFDEDDADAAAPGSGAEDEYESDDEAEPGYFMPGLDYFYVPSSKPNRKKRKRPHKPEPGAERPALTPAEEAIRQATDAARNLAESRTQDGFGGAANGSSDSSADEVGKGLPNAAPDTVTSAARPTAGAPQTSAPEPVTADGADEDGDDDGDESDSDSEGIFMPGLDYYYVPKTSKKKNKKKATRRACQAAATAAPAPAPRAAKPKQQGFSLPWPFGGNSRQQPSEEGDPAAEAPSAAGRSASDSAATPSLPALPARELNGASASTSKKAQPDGRSAGTNGASTNGASSKGANGAAAKGRKQFPPSRARAFFADVLPRDKSENGASRALTSTWFLSEDKAAAAQKQAAAPEETSDGSSREQSKLSGAGKASKRVQDE